MIRKFRNIVMAVFSVCCLLSVTSCEPDDWYLSAWWEDTSWETDRRIEDAMTGFWFLSYAEVDYGECPYRYDDEFYFRPDGLFEVRGSQGFNEKGRWYVEHGRVVVDFYNQRDEDIVGRIRDLTRHFVALDIKDYDYGSRYYLELKR